MEQCGSSRFRSHDRPRVPSGSCDHRKDCSSSLGSSWWQDHKRLERHSQEHKLVHRRQQELHRLGHKQEHRRQLELHRQEHKLVHKQQQELHKLEHRQVHKQQRELHKLEHKRGHSSRQELHRQEHKLDRKQQHSDFQHQHSCWLELHSRERIRRYQECRSLGSSHRYQCGSSCLPGCSSPSCSSRGMHGGSHRVGHSSYRSMVA